MNGRERISAIELLEGAAAELAQIDRGRDYGLWRQETAPRLGKALAQVEPFSDFRNVWIYTGDGGGHVTTPRFGEWAINLLVAKKRPEAILAAFSSEVERNSANYSEVSPIFGVEIDAPCDLSDEVTLVPEQADVLASLLHRSIFQPIGLPTGASLLYQSFTVTPSFERTGSRTSSPPKSGSVTTPEADHRDAVRKRVRLGSKLAKRWTLSLCATLKPLYLLVYARPQRYKFPPCRGACLRGWGGGGSAQPPAGKLRQAADGAAGIKRTPRRKWAWVVGLQASG